MHMYQFDSELVPTSYYVMLRTASRVDANSPQSSTDCGLLALHKNQGRNQALEFDKGAFQGIALLI